MALLDSEIARIKAELGYSLLSISTPYANVTAIFELIIQPYLTGGAVTSSATTVTAGALSTITLASGTGFTTGNRIAVDVDGAQEIVTARLVSGTALTATFLKAHTGTYPVTVEGGESIVRELLGFIRATKGEMSTQLGTGSIKKVDEIEFYQTGGTVFGLLGQQLHYWREELAAVLGVDSMWAQKRAGAQRLAVY
jgi:hypothetical protein